MKQQLLASIPVLVEGGGDYHVGWLPVEKVLVPKFHFKEPRAA